MFSPRRQRGRESKEEKEEAKPIVVNPLGYEMTQLVLEERNFPDRKSRNLLLVDVPTHNLVSKMGEACTGRKAHIAGTDNRNPRHTSRVSHDSPPAPPR